MNHNFEEWMNELLEFNSIKSIDELRQSMIAEEIQSTKEAIGNEKIWAQGSLGEVAVMHRKNIEMLSAYISYLGSLKPNMNQEPTQGMTLS
ncbi:MAG: hypothetical protein FWB93_01285 [Oscillospiraceae bacterium]|nr:hypothetical protein [Oscillospiraceae bacterium]